MSWDRLREEAGRLAPSLRAPLPAGLGRCAVCRGPARGGCAYCFHCSRHRQVAPGLLADVVVSVSYSVAGSDFARVLWRYKGEDGGDPDARSAVRALLLFFLYGHSQCLWNRAGHLVAGVTRASALAVVPTGRGRPGPHPLQSLIGSYLTAPLVTLGDTPGEPLLTRELHPGRFRVTAGRVTGVDVLLLDDTWTTGASAQSAAVALKLAGARSVAVLTLGRYLNLSDGVPELFAAAVGKSLFRTDRCAVHESARASLISTYPRQHAYKTVKWDE
ncbi:MAG TPA: hypothetical protein VGH27_10160 [Streptosporangiaceae bacterium]|jgi:hypothetical protein